MKRDIEIIAIQPLNNISGAFESHTSQCIPIILIYNFTIVIINH